MSKKYKPGAYIVSLDHLMGAGTCLLRRETAPQGMAWQLAAVVCES